MVAQRTVLRRRIVSRMTITKQTKVKANVIDQVLFRRDHDHRAKTAKTVNMEKVQQNAKSRQAPVRLENRISLCVKAS